MTLGVRLPAEEIFPAEAARRRSAESVKRMFGEGERARGVVPVGLRDWRMDDCCDTAVVPPEEWGALRKRLMPFVGYGVEFGSWIGGVWMPLADTELNSAAVSPLKRREVRVLLFV